MFNSKLILKTNNRELAYMHLQSVTHAGIQPAVMCHLKSLLCTSLCSMFVTGDVIDRKTSDDRYYVYSPYCIAVEERDVCTD